MGEYGVLIFVALPLTIAFWVGLVFLIKREKKKKEDAIRTVVNFATDIGIRDLQLKPYNGSQYIISGEHYRVADPTVIDVINEYVDGRCFSIHKLRGPFYSVQNTVVDINSVSKVYIGYDKAKANASWILGLLLIVVGVAYLIAKWNGLLITIVLVVAIIVVDILRTKAADADIKYTIIKTPQGDFTVGNMFVEEHVKKMVAQGKTNISQKQYNQVTPQMQVNAQVTPQITPQMQANGQANMQMMQQMQQMMQQQQLLQQQMMQQMQVNNNTNNNDWQP